MATDFRYGETFLVGGEPHPEVFQELTAQEQYTAVTIATGCALWGYFVMDDPYIIFAPVLAVATFVTANIVYGKNQ